jgi:hypothetical protein
MSYTIDELQRLWAEKTLDFLEKIPKVQATSYKNTLYTAAAIAFGMFGRVTTNPVTIIEGGNRVEYDKVRHTWVRVTKDFKVDTPYVLWVEPKHERFAIQCIYRKMRISDYGGKNFDTLYTFLSEFILGFSLPKAKTLKSVEKVYDIEQVIARMHDYKATRWSGVPSYYYPTIYMPVEDVDSAWDWEHSESAATFFLPFHETMIVSPTNSAISESYGNPKFYTGKDNIVYKKDGASLTRNKKQVTKNSLIQWPIEDLSNRLKKSVLDTEPMNFDLTRFVYQEPSKPDKKVSIRAIVGGEQYKGQLPSDVRADLPTYTSEIENLQTIPENVKKQSLSGVFSIVKLWGKAKKAIGLAWGEKEMFEYVVERTRRIFSLFPVEKKVEWFEVRKNHDLSNLTGETYDVDGWRNYTILGDVEDDSIFKLQETITLYYNQTPTKNQTTLAYLEAWRQFLNQFM